MLENLFQAVNQMDLSSMPMLTQQQKRIVRASESTDPERR